MLYIDVLTYFDDCVVSSHPNNLPTEKPPTLDGYQGLMKRLWRPHDLPLDKSALHDSSPVQKLVTGFQRYRRHGGQEDSGGYWADSSADASTMTPDCSADDVIPSRWKNRDQAVLCSSSSVISTSSSNT